MKLIQKLIWMNDWKLNGIDIMNGNRLNEKYKIEWNNEWKMIKLIKWLKRDWTD